MVKDIKKERSFSVDELREYYSSKYPFEPNNIRLGMYAKKIGYKPVKYRKNNSLHIIYVKNDIPSKICDQD